MGRGRRHLRQLGFIDGVGYIGAAVTGILSGWLTDAWGWDAAFYLWIAGARYCRRCFNVVTVELFYFMSRRRGNLSKILHHR